MEKKDGFRFTVRFDPEDAFHRQAAGILDRLGRKKARYIAQAVCFYEQYRAAGEGAMPLLKPLPILTGREKAPDVRLDATGQESRVNAGEFAVHKSRETEGLWEENAGKGPGPEEIAAMKNGMNAFRKNGSRQA